MSIKQALAVLNQGASSAGEVKTIRNAAYARLPGQSHSQEEIKAAAIDLRRWLVKENSMVCACIAFLSGAGVCYVAWMHENGLHAFVECGDGTGEAFALAVSPRRSTASSAVPSDCAAFAVLGSVQAGAMCASLGLAYGLSRFLIARTTATVSSGVGTYCALAF